LYAKGDEGFWVNDVHVDFGWLRRIYLLVIQEEREKKTQNLGLFFYVFLPHDDKEEEMCVCVCVWNERIFAGAAAECASARRETDVM
jgi:hypothetical protein